MIEPSYLPKAWEMSLPLWGFKPLAVDFLILLSIVGVGCMAFLAKTMVNVFYGRIGLGRYDEIRLVGSFILEGLHGARFVGTTILLVTSFLFTGCYFWFFLRFCQSLIHLLPLIGSFLGLCHGLILCPAFVTTMADFHPLPRFQKPQLQDIFVGIFCNGVFGACIGTCYYVFFRSMHGETTELFLLLTVIFTAGMIFLITSMVLLSNINKLLKESWVTGELEFELSGDEENQRESSSSLLYLVK